jgi:hypothetical protein
MTVRLSTTVRNIEKNVSNQQNAEIIAQFFKFMKRTGTSEKYQNNNLKAIIAYASHFKSPQITQMINLLTDLRMKYKVDKTCVDGSDPSFIYALKERLREWPVDYHSVPKVLYINIMIEPVSFVKQQYEFLVHDKAILEDKAL